MYNHSASKTGKIIYKTILKYSRNNKLKSFQNMMLLNIECEYT